MPCPVFFSKIFPLPSRPKSPAYPARLIPHEGRIAIVTNVGMGCGGRGSVVAQGVAGRIFHCAKVRERFAGAWTNGASTPRLKCGRQHMADPRIGRGRCGRQKRVVPAPVAGAKPAEVYEPNRARQHHQSAGDGGKTNSSPGRARHKPLKPSRRKRRVFSVNLW